MAEPNGTTTTTNADIEMKEDGTEPSLASLPSAPQPLASSLLAAPNSPLPPMPAAPHPSHAQPPTMAAPTPPPPTPAAGLSSTSTQRPTSIPPAQFLQPEKPNAHGSPTRVYLNQNVTPHLLEGMKFLAANEPERPLAWLSEFLAKRSAECEG